MSYATFAQLLSFTVVCQYIVLLIIVIRRAHVQQAVNGTEDILRHARYLEGPVIAVLLLTALFTAAAAVIIAHPEYATVAAFLVASIRGALFILGCWLLAWYWRQRDTWR